MKTKEQLEQEFRSDLQDLLNKYGAELSAEDHFQGYPECGENVLMTVMIPEKFEENGECIQPYTEINLGRYQTAKDEEPTLKHNKDCELGDNWKDCPACKEHNLE